MILPTGIKKVVLPLAILFLFGAVWYGLFKPEFAKISKYRAQPAAARTPATARETAEWASLEEAIIRRLPKGKQISGLYAQLSVKAEQCELRNFERRDLEGSESSYEDGGIARSGYSIELTFDCSYSSLIRFLNGLQAMERLVDVVRLEINRKFPLVGVRIVLRNYFIP